MNNIALVNLESTYESVHGIWQWDYGQILRIQSKKKLPKAVEVHFSLQEKGGESVTRIGTTTDGITDVPIPDTFLENNGATQDYKVYAFVYIENGESGNTEYRIKISVNARPKPEVPGSPEEPELFKETIKAVNDAADRAETSERNAKTSELEAGRYAESASESTLAVKQSGEDALKEIGNKKQDAVSAVDEKGQESLSAIQQQKQESLSSIQEQEKNSVSKVTEQADTEVQRIQNTANESKGALDQSIKEASEKKSILDESVRIASTAKTELDKSVENGKETKNLLDASTETAGKSKTALDNSIQNATDTNTELSKTVTKANDLNAFLEQNIETGIQLKSDLVEAGEKAVQDINTAGSEQLSAMQNVAEEFTADREQVKKNKEDIAELSDKKITKFYTSNLGETHLADSDNGKVADMMLYGKSEQKKYQGYQLLSANTTVERNGVTAKFEYGKITLNGTNNSSKTTLITIPSVCLIEKDVTYTYKVSDIPKGMDDVAIYGDYITVNKSIPSDKGKKSGACSAYIYVLPGATLNNAVVYAMLEKGSVAHDYEPYVGGKPSPSPEYPQEIKSVVNPTIKVCGKNLFNKNAFIKFDNAYIGEDNAIASGNDNRGFIIKLNKGTYYYTQYTVYTDVQIAFFKDYPNLGNMAERLIRNDTAAPVNQKNVLNDTGYLFIKYSHRVTDGDIPQQTILDSILLMCDGEDSSYEPYKEQSVQLPITLNAIPVKSGGNVTINGQQYISDYVDVERGKLVRLCYLYKFDMADYVNTLPDETIQDMRFAFKLRNASKEQYTRIGLSNIGYKHYQDIDNSAYPYGVCIVSMDTARIRVKGVTNKSELAEYLASNNVFLLYALRTQNEEELTTEQAQALKELSTYYPVTNITIGSEQLYGYTAFNYPVSMANGWNYVKQQLNDNRDYIYDMDLQSAEAYVNSEYAVALTELEVM